MDKWTIETYRDARGRSPVEDYMSDCQPKDRARIARTILLLEDYGPALRMPHARHLQSRLWELRIDGRPNSYRVLYAAVPDHKFVLLHIFAKKTDKTPAKEVQAALRRLDDYQARRISDE